MFLSESNSKITKLEKHFLILRLLCWRHTLPGTDASGYIFIKKREAGWFLFPGTWWWTGPQGLFRPAWVHRSSEVDCVKVSETFVNHIPALQSSAVHDFWLCGSRHLHDIHTRGSMWMMSPVAILLAFPASCTRLNTLWLLCHLPKCPEGNLAKGSCLLRFKSRFRMPRFDLVS